MGSRKRPQREKRSKNVAVMNFVVGDRAKDHRPEKEIKK